MGDRLAGIYLLVSGDRGNGLVYSYPPWLTPQQSLILKHEIYSELEGISESKATSRSYQWLLRRRKDNETSVRKGEYVGEGLRYVKRIDNESASSEEFDSSSSNVSSHSDVDSHLHNQPTATSPDKLVLRRQRRQDRRHHSVFRKWRRTVRDLAEEAMNSSTKGNKPTVTDDNGDDDRGEDATADDNGDYIPETISPSERHTSLSSEKLKAVGCEMLAELGDRLSDQTLETITLDMYRRSRRRGRHRRMNKFGGDPTLKLRDENYQGKEPERAEAEEKSHLGKQSMTSKSKKNAEKEDVLNEDEDESAYDSGDTSIDDARTSSAADIASTTRHFVPPSSSSSSSSTTTTTTTTPSLLTSASSALPPTKGTTPVSIRLPPPEPFSLNPRDINGEAHVLGSIPSDEFLR